MPTNSTRSLTRSTELIAQNSKEPQRCGSFLYMLLLQQRGFGSAHSVGVRLLDNDEANITLGSAKTVDLLPNSDPQTLHFKARMEVPTGTTATAGQVEANANYVLMYK